MIKGIAASPGIAIGKVFVLEEEDFFVHRYTIDEDDIKTEVARFKRAVHETKEELKQMREKVIKQLGKQPARLFDAYLLIVDDAMLRDEIIKIITKERLNVEFALQTVITRIAKTFSLIPDEYFAERGSDIMDIGKKIMHNLLGQERETLSSLISPVIVVAHNLTPSDTIAMREEKVIGFATDIGGKTSHTTIMAQSLEIPAVVGLKNITDLVKPGDMLIVDGGQGVVIVNPDPMTISNYEREQKRYFTIVRELESIRDLSAKTLDGFEVELAANIEVPDEIPSVLDHGARGIGLYRTEYLFLDRESLPTEQEQYEAYRFVAEKMLPYPVIIRTMDLGADKFQDTYNIYPERNPFMGMRAIRFCLRHPEIFKTQLRAILRASVSGNLKIMYPMICCVEELREANQILMEVKEELRKGGVDFNPDIDVGTMIEVPAAALTCDILAQETDFFSIGTNDLIQYTLAVDRVNENVTHLYKPLHLSVLRLIKSIVEAGHKAGRWVGMCGEMAADPCFIRILLGLGLDEFSMASVAIPKIKQIIRSTTKEEARAIAQEVLSCQGIGEVLDVLKKHKIE